jgi:glutathione peroxidase
MRLKPTLAVFGLSAFVLSVPASACPQLLKHSFTPLMGGVERSLCQYQDKVVLVVNTASNCGFTPQFERLEALHRKYQERGLVVLGFPSNDFGGQEPGTAPQIAEFCQVNYGVSFPVFAKSAVRGANANPVFRELAAKTGSAPRWNFHKYLVDRNGAPVASFATQVEPTDPKLVREIERLLGR